MSLPRLRDYRGDTIDMACRRCDRFGSYERKALVKKFGAHIEFAEIRRCLSIGCEHAGTDKCEAMFPCLMQASILIEKATR
jgi:hypothetical protein